MLRLLLLGLHLCLVVGITASIRLTPAHAADVTCDFTVESRGGYRSCLFGLLKGSIEVGDYDKIINLYRNERGVSGFLLISPGGHAGEAIKIGRFFRKYLMSATAPRMENGKFALRTNDDRETGAFKTLCEGPDCVCASACALIWLGAVERIGTVGLHRPWINDARFKGLHPNDASALYRELLKDISRYLDEIETPRTLIDALIATGSSDIRWVDSLSEGIQHPPSFVEWLDAACGAYSAHELRIGSDLYKKKSAEGLTPQETKSFEALVQKRLERAKCMMPLLLRHRMQLPVP